jgi:chorismate mutase
MSKHDNDLPLEARERMERIVTELVGIAARAEISPALREELMRLAAQTCSMLEDDSGLLLKCKSTS